MLLQLDEITIKRLREEAEKLGLTFQEYLLYRILMHLDDLKVSAFVEGHSAE